MLAGILFAACFLRRRDAAVVALGAMLLRDAISGFSLFTMVRLAAMLGVVGVITALRLRPTLPSLGMGLLLSSPAYHLILSTGDWVTQTCTKTPLTMQGLAETLAGTAPYAQRAFVGDVLLTSLLVGLYTLAGYLGSLRWPSVLPQRL
jgi:hypothetical protein